MDEYRSGRITDPAAVGLKTGKNYDMNNTPNQNMQPGMGQGFPPYGQGQPFPPANQGQPFPQNGAFPQSGMMPPYGQPASNGQMPPRGAFPQQAMPPYPQQFPQQQNPNTRGGKTKPAKKSNKKKWVTLGIFGGIGLLLGIFVFIIVNKYAKQLTVIDIPGAPVIASTTKVTAVDTDGDGTADTDVTIDDTPKDMAQVTTEKGETWDGSTRITCLAMGLDYRDWLDNDGAPRSDTMMLLTYDPVTKFAGMLSLPRDLWVAIPDHGYGRINTAYSLGEGEQLPGVNGKPGGGAGLAMRTVELFLGIDIQYFAVINFNGFIDFIDMIDKLAINVRDDITVGEENGVPIHLMAGVQDLDGKTALAYARYRYTSGGDFERAQRQQDVIFAIFEQIKWQLPELLTKKFDQFFGCIQKAVNTNIPLSDMLKLAWTVTEINPYMIKRAVIAPPDQVLYGNTADGTQAILIPIPDKIREARDVIWADRSFGANQLSDDYGEADRLRDEAAKVTLLNGCSVPGIFEKTVEYLQQFGIQIVSVGSGSANAYNTMDIKKGCPYTARFFSQLMQIPTGAITMNYDPASEADIVLTITDAWANNNTM